MTRAPTVRTLSLLFLALVGVTVAACRPIRGGESNPPAALPGYHRVMVGSFTGGRLPSGWHPYAGHEGTDAAGWWDPSHVVVGHGLLTLRTFRDPAHYGLGSGTPWVEGGVDLWPKGVLTDGVYLVRSRVTSATGVTQVELLWPDNSVWPPEIDFNESNGTNESTATLIYGTSGGSRLQQQVQAPRVDLTQWHTWGVVVTPRALAFTLDGRLWGIMPNREQTPMHLAIQQQVWPCLNDAGRSCPGAWTPPETDLQVSWVAVYAPGRSGHHRRG